MLTRYLAALSLALVLSWPGAARAADVPVDLLKCRTVAEGLARVISFTATRLDGTQVQLQGLLSVPPGAKARPVLVMLPGARGLIIPYCYGSRTRDFAKWGYATLVVAPRSARSEDGRQLWQYSFADLGSYGHGAATALAARADIDPERIALWGHSNGGMAVLDTVSHAADAPGPIRAAVAAAPICPARVVPPSVPLLVLIGSADRDTPAAGCASYASKLADTRDFEFVLLPDAGHLYWVRQAPDYDEAAARLADRRLKAFLETYLPASR